MMILIFLPMLLIVWITFYVTYRSAAKPREVILLAVTIPARCMDREDVQTMRGAYLRQINRLYLGAAALLVPTIWIAYVSILLLYLAFWCLGVYRLSEWILCRFSGKLRALKKEEGWSAGRLNRVSIDTEVSRMKGSFPIAKGWFLLPAGLAAAPLLAGGILGELDLWLWVAGGSSLLITLVSLLLYRLVCISSARANCIDTEINLACNRLRIREWTACWARLAGVEGLAGMLCSFYRLGGGESPYPAIGILTLAGIGSIVWVIRCHRRVQKQQNTLLAAQEKVWYVDEDEYWRGSSYHNPNDARVTVEKRVGFGYVFNTGTTKGKAVTYGISAAVTVLVIGIWLLLLRLDFAEFTMSISGRTVTIDAPLYSTRFSLDDIEQVLLVDEVPEGSKIKGGGTKSYRLGDYNVKGYGRSRLYVYRDYSPCLAIRLSDRWVFFNSREQGVTKSYYENLNQSYQKTGRSE